MTTSAEREQLSALRELVAKLNANQIGTSDVDQAIASAVAHPSNERAVLEGNSRMWLVTARESHRLLRGELTKVSDLVDQLEEGAPDRDALVHIQQAFTMQVEGLEALLVFLANGDADALQKAGTLLHAGAAKVDGW